VPAAVFKPDEFEARVARDLKIIEFSFGFITLNIPF